MVERTKVKGGEKEPKPWWRKVGRGSFRLANGKIIKPNQRFQADVDDLPKHAQDLVVPLDQGKTVAQKKEETKKDTKQATPKFNLIHKGNGWYDVVNEDSGKVVNAKSLRQADAQKLIEELV